MTVSPVSVPAWSWPSYDALVTPRVGLRKFTNEGKRMKRLIAILAILALVLAACGGDDSGDGGDGGGDSGVELEGDATAGEDIFASTCATCHGPDATGIEGLGKDLHNNAFVDERSDAEMVAFLEEGRPAGDPLNTTGVDMPPKGGNPSLSDQDLYDVVAYLRTLD